MSSFTTLPDLAVDRWGGAVPLANDEFFAPRENLVKAGAPAWREGVYTERGKWMDGWETRRRRAPGYDWCIVRLGLPGAVHGVVVDTSYFTGNFPEACSLDAAEFSGTPDESALLAADWTPILPEVALKGDCANAFAIATVAVRRWTHLRLSIFPDGGIARLRVHGVVMPDWKALLRPCGWVDLAALAIGARVVAQSDAHYGDPRNMLQPGRATHMGDGWETRRRRAPGNEWAVVRLAARGRLHRIEVDTDHYKGNAPGWFSVDQCDSEDTVVEGEAASWVPLIAHSPLQPDARHQFEVSPAEAASYIRLNIFPDGGIARLRVFGWPEPVPA